MSGNTSTHSNGNGAEEVRENEVEQAVNIVELGARRRRKQVRPMRIQQAPISRQEALDTPMMSIMHLQSGADIINSLAEVARRRQCMVYILFAFGKVASATLSNAWGEIIPDFGPGPLEILTLSGSFRRGENPAITMMTCGNSDTNIIGGNVVGPLVASGTVEVTVFMLVDNGSSGN